MPTNFVSPALYIDFARLPPPAVIEEIDFEILLQAYKAGLLVKNPDLEQAILLEQSPTNIILEVEAYGEMLVRARVNDAARAVMLAFAVGTDLDNLAALYNVLRLTDETDERFRRRVQVAAESFTTAGSAGAYIFHAMTAAPTLRDVTAIMTEPGSVQVSLLNSGVNPVATVEHIRLVRDRLLMPNIKPLTDMISVIAGEKITVDVKATLTLYPGPDAALIMADVTKAMEKVRSRINLLGRDLTRSALISAMYQEGVQNVDLAWPAQDIVVASHQFVWITSADIQVTGRTE
jgi:phage-related baseplate assembly protein